MEAPAVEGAAGGDSTATLQTPPTSAEFEGTAGGDSTATLQTPPTSAEFEGAGGDSTAALHRDGEMDVDAPTPDRDDVTQLRDLIRGLVRQLSESQEANKHNVQVAQDTEAVAREALRQTKEVGSTPPFQTTRVCADHCAPQAGDSRIAQLNTRIGSLEKDLQVAYEHNRGWQTAHNAWRSAHAAMAQEYNKALAALKKWREVHQSLTAEAQDTPSNDT
jgi:hypothetical protein